MKEKKRFSKFHVRMIRHMRQYYPSLKAFREVHASLMRDVPDNNEHFVYLYPLCLQQTVIFGRTVGVKWTGDFSFDHFPAESVGGKHTALVCKECNSNAGEDYDFALKAKMQCISFDNKVKGSRLPIKTSIENVRGNYSSSIFITDNGVLEVDLDPKDKTAAPFIAEWIANPGNDWEAKITLFNPDEEKVSKALLKAAYLYCFVNWGYEFVFSATGDMIRKVLAGEVDYPIQCPIFWLGQSVRQNQISHFPIGLCYLQKPATCKSFAVNIRLENMETGYADIATVLIPGPDSWDQLNSVGSQLQELMKVSIDLSFAHVMDFLVTDGVYDGYSKSWEKLQSFK